MGFADHTVSVVTMQPCHPNTKAAIDKKSKIMGHDCNPIELICGQ